MNVVGGKPSKLTNLTNSLTLCLLQILIMIYIETMPGKYVLFAIRIFYYLLSKRAILSITVYKKQNSKSYFTAKEFITEWARYISEVNFGTLADT